MKWMFVLALLASGCAQVTSLNLKKHEFGILPTKIIWFQIAGLDLEQVAMLRFQFAGERKTAFEDHTCIGNAWSYNSYNLRPKAHVGFMAQLTGKKNIKNTCEDAELTPIWTYLNSHGYHTGILEIGADKVETLTKMTECGESGKTFLTSPVFWLRADSEKAANTYHYREPIALESEKVYFNKTCSKGNCFSTIVDDFNAIHAQFNKSFHKNLFIIRDFSYLKALEKGNIAQAKLILSDLERTVAESLKLIENNSEALVLITSGDSRYVDMPDQGKQWFDFEKLGANANVKRTKLMNTVIASGARAENFCGAYDDAQVFERILSGPKQLGLELKLINPFNN